MNVLFLTHRLPYAPNRGDRIRAYYLLREMSRFASVTLFSLVHDDEEAAHGARMPFAHQTRIVRVPRMQNLARGLASLASDRPLTHLLLDAPRARAILREIVAERPPDVIVAFCSSMARFAVEPPLAGFPLLLDMVDVDSVKWADLAASAKGPRRWIYRREARTLAAFETVACRHARATLVVNQREHDALRPLAPAARIEVVENGIDAEAFRPPGEPSSTPTVVFCGVMNYRPNEEGVRWFGEHVWPLVAAARPDARFVVVGASPTRAVSDLAAAHASIEVLGRVATVQPHLWASAIAVAPLLISRGLQNKVLEALAAGLPVVVTRSVFAGLPDDARAGCVAADTPSEFASAVLRLLSLAPHERRALAWRVDLHRLEWAGRLSAVEHLLTDARAEQRRV